MRLLLVPGVIAAATMLATVAKAQNYPWCAIYKGGAMNCGFTTFQQCLTTVSEAGFCIQNSTYQPLRDRTPGIDEAILIDCSSRYGSFAKLTAILHAASL